MSAEYVKEQSNRRMSSECLPGAKLKIEAKSPASRPVWLSWAARLTLTNQVGHGAGWRVGARKSGAHKGPRAVLASQGRKVALKAADGLKC